MLQRVDKVLALVTWLAAGLVVVMLLFGPALVAHDASGTPPVTSYGATPTADGKQLFVTNCGSCHTLTAAGTSGQLGPNLDHTKLSTRQIAAQIHNGGGSMPAFGGSLTAAQIQSIATFVASQR